jgi:hypothetical protein
MAHFAQLNDKNYVTNVIVIDNNVVDNLSFPDSEPLGVAFCQGLYGADTIWKQTSYNSSFRGHYAGIGWLYDPIADVFVEPQPYPSWTFNAATGKWEAPVPMPTIPDGYKAVWDEIAQEWDTILDRAI